jgi:AcrR family transcriptional regulator
VSFIAASCPLAGWWTSGRIRNIVLEVENVVPTLVARRLADRQEVYSSEIRALLEAALVVMQRDDSIDPKVADIVRQAGLSNQAFYRHFDGKDALLLTLLADGRERLAGTVERRMARAGARDRDARIRAWMDAVFDQARDPAAAAATRPFVANAERLALEYPTEVAQSQEQLLAPLRSIVGGDDARAVHHLAMGLVHETIAARRSPTRAETDAVTEFAIRGCTHG